MKLLNYLKGLLYFFIPFFLLIILITTFYYFDILNNQIIKYFKMPRITLSGYVLSRNIHLSRKKMYSINKVIHYFGKTDHYERIKYRVKNSLFAGDWITGINMLKLQDGQGNEKSFASVADVLNYLCGYRAFIISIISSVH